MIRISLPYIFKTFDTLGIDIQNPTHQDIQKWIEFNQRLPYKRDAVET